MKFLPWIAALVIVTTLPLACKQPKAQVADNKKVADTAPLLRADVWQGTEDRIDPQLGALKTLEK